MEEMTVHEPTEMERLALEREQTLRRRWRCANATPGRRSC